MNCEERGKLLQLIEQINWWTNYGTADASRRAFQGVVLWEIAFWNHEF